MLFILIAGLILTSIDSQGVLNSIQHLKFYHFVSHPAHKSLAWLVLALAALFTRALSSPSLLLSCCNFFTIGEVIDGLFTWYYGCIFSSRLQFTHDFEGETKVGALSTVIPINSLWNMEFKVFHSNCGLSAVKTQKYPTIEEAYQWRIFRDLEDTKKM